MLIQRARSGVSSRPVRVVVPEMRERLLALASPPVGGPPEQFAQHIKGEIDKWARVIRAANIKPE